MNKIEHLLVCLIEECSEVQKEATKALRFGLDDKWKSEYSSIEKMTFEFYELMAVFQMLKDEEIIPAVDVAALMGRKKERVLQYMEYARQRGALERTEQNG